MISNFSAKIIILNSIVKILFGNSYRCKVIIDEYFSLKRIKLVLIKFIK